MATSLFGSFEKNCIARTHLQIGTADIQGALQPQQPLPYFLVLQHAAGLALPLLHVWAEIFAHTLFEGKNDARGNVLQQLRGDLCACVCLCVRVLQQLWEDLRARMCASVCVCVYGARSLYKSRGGYLRPKCVCCLHAPRVQDPKLESFKLSPSMDFNAAELETGSLGEPYLISCGVNPTFWEATCCIWAARVLNWVNFAVLESL